MTAAFANAARAFQTGPEPTTYRLNPYTKAAPSMSSESASNATEPASRPAVNSAMNIAAFRNSTIRRVATCPFPRCANAEDLSVQQASIVQITPNIHFRLIPQLVQWHVRYGRA